MNDGGLPPAILRPHTNSYYRISYAPTPADRQKNFSVPSLIFTRHPSAELTDDMTVADLLDVLEHLPFAPRGGSCMLQLDRGISKTLLAPSPAGSAVARALHPASF